MVTGGAGYIGSHACKTLAMAGHEPVVFDNLRTGHRSAVKWGPFEYGDIGDSQRLAQVFSTYRPDAVIHFAALAYVGESFEHPGVYYRTNVAHTLNLLDTMLRSGTERLVFSSSCATYGVPEILPITEDTVQNPINPYGRSKLMVEQIIADYAAAHGLRYASLRYFNAAGADPEGELGEDHEPETHLIPLVLQVAAGRRPDIKLYGRDYPTADGTCIRDYIHVADLAAAHVAALEGLLERSDVFNLGIGKGYSVLEVVDAVSKVTGKKVPISNGSRRPGDPPVLIADAAKAKIKLGWHPRYPELTTMVRHAWAWYERQQNCR